MKHLDLERKDSALIVFFLSVIALLIVLALNSCTKPTDHISLIVNESSLFKSPVMLQFENANPTSAVQPDNFNVTISGKDSALVQMDGGGSNFQASGGFLPLTLLAAANPSPANPVTFNVSADIPGFAPIVQTVTITSASPSNINISVVEYANPAPGTAVLVNQSTLTNGISKGVTLNLQPSAGMVESASIAITAGTQMMDVQGNAINAQQLTSSIIDYSAVSNTSYTAFPGGFNPTNIVDSAGNQINGGQGIHFVSAGLISIKMTAGTTPVRHFSKPLAVSMRLAPNTTNLTTGNNIQAGDVVPLWSLTEETGQWKSEGNVTITTDGGGNLVANFQTTHLCVFNLDWRTSTCNNPLKVTFHCQAGRAGIYEVYLVTPCNQYLAAAHGTYVTDGLTLTFPYVPQIAQCKVVILNFTPTLTAIAETALFNPCSLEAIDLTFTAPPASQYIDVTFTVSAHCSNKNITFPPSGYFRLHDDSGPKGSPANWATIYLTDGVITYLTGMPVSGINGTYNITLISGHKYHIYTFYADKLYSSQQITMAPKSFVYNNGSGISCTGIYNSASNSINITGSYSIPCH